MEDAGGADVAAVGDVGVVDTDAAGSGNRADGAVGAVVVVIVGCVRVGVGLVVEAAESAGVE